MAVARVFPQKTKRSPRDKYAFYGPPDLFLPDDIDEVHVSVIFTYDIPQAEFLAEQWRHVAPVKINGPAYDITGEEFVPGRYLRKGCTITSRGCPNRCWFCKVWRREGNLRELTIRDGYYLLDDNILAASESHIRRVFDMLSRQRQKIELVGGLEPARLKDWHIELMYKLKRKPLMNFAYDEEADYEPLVEVAKKLWKTDLMDNGNAVCYMMVGWPGDTKTRASKRLLNAIQLGFLPLALPYMDEEGNVPDDWMKFKIRWCRPIILKAKIEQIKRTMPADRKLFTVENWEKAERTLKQKPDNNKNTLFD